MFIYVLRRALYSIPVLLLATFFVFWHGARDVRPDREARADARRSRRSARAARGARPRPSARSRSTATGCRRASTATSATAGRPAKRSVDDVQPAFWNTIQLIFWGILISAIVALFVGVYSAVRQYSDRDYAFTGLAFIGIAMPPFWFGLIAFDFSTKLADWFNDGDPVLLRARAALGRASPASTGTTSSTSCCRSRR